MLQTHEKRNRRKARENLCPMKSAGNIEWETRERWRDQIAINWLKYRILLCILKACYTVSLPNARDFDFANCLISMTKLLREFSNITSFFQEDKRWDWERLFTEVASELQTEWDTGKETDELEES